MLLLVKSYMPTRSLSGALVRGSQLGALTPHHQAFFWRHCRGERRFLQGESLTLNLLLYFCFALLYFCMHHFIKNTKKLASLIVVTSLLLVHYVVP
jgi:hypothetical protein